MAATRTTECGQTWSRRRVLGAGAVAGAGAMTGLAGCSSGSGSEGNDKIKQKIKNPGDNFNRNGFPIVDKPITLDFMTGKRAGHMDDYNKVASWNYYQKKTNIKVSWGLVPDEALKEKRNLALNGGDYAGVLYGQWLDTFDVGKYGNQGTFIKLNELIDKYMPSLQKVLDEYPDIKKGMTFPDDGIYGLPSINDPNFPGLRIGAPLWVRGDWLDKFDMDVPKTTDEYYRYLKQVKAKQPNGKGNTVGYCDRLQGDRLIQGLLGSFGIGNRGVTQEYLDSDPKDEDRVRFYSITTEYRALLEYLHRLYNDGSIAKNIFSIDLAKVGSAAVKGNYGSVGEISPGHLHGGKAKNFVPMPALKGPEGDHSYNAMASPLTSVGQFVITDNCKHLAETARWVDYFYSDAGTKLFHMGVKGKSYKETEHGVEYLDKIKDNAKGMSQDEALKKYVIYPGGGYPGIIKEEYFKGTEASDEQTKAAKLLKPDELTEIWPAFTYTQDEADRLDSLRSDIEKYVDESTDKFISGDLNLSQWNTYVDKIKKMGLDDYMEIQQAAYDRYRKA